MKTKKSLFGVCALVATALGALSATAGIKYWDNPAYKAFDVGDYVQDGLVLNYDGIRNAGADLPHDSTATTWVNCKNPGTYDLTKVAVSGSTASWEDGKGFHFDGKAYFKYPAKAKLPAEYEFEVLLDAKTADATANIGQIYFSSYSDPRSTNDGAWGKASLAIRQKDNPFTVTGSSKCTLVFNTQTFTRNNNSRPGLVGDTSFKYLTALANSSYTCVFTGLEEPTSAPGRFDGTTESFDAYFFLGGHGVENDNSKVAETMIGTMKNFRRYNKVLTPEQRAWNRVVDEARYFGRSAALPVTNVVVASNIPIVTGDEPIGCYAVDGSHTFSAPASKVVKGRNYTLDGFTIETWDGSAWGTAVQHTGETSYNATDAALVRLTWQWTAGDGLVRYDADDYVQYGLVLNYDGIRNAGLGAAHDSAATTWKNLGNGGAAYDMTRYSLVDGAWTEGAAQGAWTDTGFTFGTNSVFNESAEITIPTKRTMQVLVDAKASDQSSTTAGSSTTIGDVIGCYNGTYWAYYTLCMRKSGGIENSFYLNVFNGGATARPAIYNENHAYDYGTAIVDGNDSVFFSGTTAPWSASSTGGTTGHYKNAGYTPVEYKDAGLSIGGRYPSQEERFQGTVKFFRFYGRCLTDAEVAWNRVVDDWRYSGTAVTNVVVASTRVDVQANEPDGVYEVSGSYTFTAPESVTVGTLTFAPTGYAIQAWDDAAGCWGAATEYTGSSYAYTTAAGKVRLLWRWKTVGGIRTAADYDVSDYVAGGLTFHLDGIRNVGATEDHAEAPATWVNLGTSGSAGDTTIRNGDAERVVNWTGKGYRFDGNTRFFGTIPYTTTFTLQLLTDAVQNDQHNPDSAHMYPFTADNKGFAISTYDTRLYFRTQGNDPVYALGFGIDKSSAIGYVTAMLDDATKTARIFPGVTSSAGGSQTYESMSTEKYTNLTLGGGGSGSGQFWIGTINCFRYYDRVLSDDELAQNREVDEARYFGKLAVTNVVASVSGEETAYKVEGRYTFTAPATVVEKGEAKKVVCYTTEELVDGVWKNKVWHDVTEDYTYDVATSGGKTIRLTWRGPRPGLVIVVR